MPTPLGHALGGLAAGLLLLPAGTTVVAGAAPAAARLPTWQLLGLTAVAAALPDVDFLWGRHNMETHSLGAALAAGVLAWLWWRRDRDAWRIASAVTVAWATHVLFDCLGSDDTPPVGVMALWPVTSTFYLGDVGFFDAISRRYWLPNFWSHNLRAVVKEALVLVPLCALATFSRARGGRALRVDPHARPATTRDDGR